MKDQRAFEDWKRDIYPEYWSRASRKYGQDAYCAGLLALIKKFSPRDVFELAIGNGFPFAESLVKENIKVTGCDISEHLIAELKESLPEVHAFVGGYADPKISQLSEFDLVYCFRSTWHFPDIDTAIDFMLRVAKPNGIVLFDIMNADSEWNRHFVMRKNILFPVTLLKNSIKYVLNKFLSRQWLIDKVFGVRDIMYSRKFISDLLINRGLTFEVMDLLQIEKLGTGFLPSSNVSCDQKLIFIVSKH